MSAFSHRRPPQIHAKAARKKRPLTLFLILNLFSYPTPDRRSGREADRKSVLFNKSPFT